MIRNVQNISINCKFSTSKMHEGFLLQLDVVLIRNSHLRPIFFQNYWKIIRTYCCVSYNNR